MARTFRISRRRALTLAGVTAAAGAGAGVAAGRATPEATASPADPDVLSYPFHGEHQAGITTPAQDRLHFAAFDVDDISREELIGLLKDWTAAAARMSQGGSAGDFAPEAGPYEAPPEDTGEAMDLGPTGLTITFGFGPTLFTTADGTDRDCVGTRKYLASPGASGKETDAAKCAVELNFTCRVVLPVFRAYWARWIWPLTSWVFTLVRTAGLSQVNAS